jgi:hypothetical protein
MRYVNFLPTCRFKKWTPALEWILHCLNLAMNTYNDLPILIVTSVNDSNHSKNPLSRHYTDEAIDVRTHYFNSTDEKLRFKSIVEGYLNTHPNALRPNAFTAMLEYLGQPEEHLHIQVKMGESYP